MGGLLPLFHFNPASILLAWAIFFGVLFLLGKTAWGPILKALDERDDRIRFDLDQAKHQREEAEKTRSKHDAMMAKMRDEISQLRSEARESGKREREHILETARKDVEQMREVARQEIRQDRQNARDEIREMAVRVGTGMARKILRREIDRERHADVIRESLEDIDRAFEQAG